MTFTEFWKVFPHYPGRSKKVLARAKWDAITGAGLTTRMNDGDGNMVTVTLRAPAAAIVEAAKAYAREIDGNSFDRPITEVRRYAAGAHVYLNQGRWEDWAGFEDFETDERIVSIGAL